MDDDAVGEIIGELRDELKELRQENQRLREEGDTEEVKPPAPSNDEIVESFFSEKNYAKSSERPKRFSIKYYRSHIDDNDLRDVTTGDALDFANNWTGESEPPKRATMLTYLGNIKVLYDWMMRHEWDPDENVVDDARDRYKSQNRSQIKRSRQHSGTVIKPEEYLQLMRSNIMKRAKSFLVLAVKTGLRRKELVSLKVQDLDLEKQVVYNRSPKGVGEVRVPKDSADQKLLDDEVVSAIEDWLDTREVTGAARRTGTRGSARRRGTGGQ
jgi:Site-specific recombinase XerD